MENIGPSLETLTHRMTEIPSEFLQEPRIEKTGSVHVDALVNDLCHLHGVTVHLSTLERFQGKNIIADRNRLAVVMLAVWLLADEWFVAHKPEGQGLIKILDLVMAELAALTPAHKFVNDPDRREEFVRIVLANLNFRPLGETIEQAIDRLSSVSGTERKRLLEASRAAEARARAIREALVRKSAEESADKWTRE